MLGHASAAMTLDTYADLFDDDLDAVASRLNDAMPLIALPTGPQTRYRRPQRGRTCSIATFRLVAALLAHRPGARSPRSTTAGRTWLNDRRRTLPHDRGRTLAQPPGLCSLNDRTRRPRKKYPVKPRKRRCPWRDSNPRPAA